MLRAAEEQDTSTRNESRVYGEYLRETLLLALRGPFRYDDPS
jgi:hypothetical protein